nr:RDD family protein [Cryobacterium roopkundense]
MGLPRSGPGSVARPGRRIAGVAIDWALAVVVSVFFFQYNALATTVIFVVLQLVFIPTLGGSIGHRFVGLRVVPLFGGWIGPWRGIVRSVLLGVVLPALVWDSDQRGFHDKFAGTVLIRS